jgi:hypothetical protein
VSYLGSILGLVYVELLADMKGLRGAMVAVAALAVSVFVLTPALLCPSGFKEPAKQRYMTHQRHPRTAANSPCTQSRNWDEIEPADIPQRERHAGQHDELVEADSNLRVGIHHRT